MKDEIYGVYWNDMTWESSGSHVSLHYTKKGAYKAFRKLIEDRYKNWFEERMLRGKRWNKGSKWNEWEAFDIEILKIEE